ncbi:MAG: DUF721 domain-containing protein [Deltaproteobacteria bacterium]|nr:DUF721 domain-containing protein [Deltaproteobacteria bacterium]MBW2135349.1 DUF721 domain-containing protein [Deltaproteobacteria bacterium]
MSKRIKLPRPVSVSEVLKKVLKPADLLVTQQRAQIRAAWERIISDQLRAQTRLVDYQRKVLWVEVQSSLWMQELQFLKSKILADLNEILGPGVVNDLRFRIGAE